jgi:hypothetical protein
MQNKSSKCTSERFHTTRDEQRGLVSINTADAGLLINRKKQPRSLIPASPFFSTLTEAI